MSDYTGPERRISERVEWEALTARICVHFRLVKRLIAEGHIERGDVREMLVPFGGGHDGRRAP